MLTAALRRTWQQYTGTIEDAITGVISLPDPLQCKYVEGLLSCEITRRVYILKK